MPHGSGVQLGHANLGAAQGRNPPYIRGPQGRRPGSAPVAGHPAVPETGSPWFRSPSPGFSPGLLSDLILLRPGNLKRGLQKIGFEPHYPTRSRK